MSKTKDHYWLKSGAYSLLQRLSVVLFGFGSFYLLVRTLDKSTYGTWVLYITATTFIEVIRNGLIQNALVRFLSSNEKEVQPKIISASFTISAGLTLLCIGLNLLFARSLSLLWESPELEGMFYLYNIVFVIAGFFYQFQYIEQANFKFNGIFITTTIRQGSLFVFILMCSLFGTPIDLISLVYVQIIGTALATLIAYLYAKPFFALSFKGSMEWVKKLFHYGKYVFGTSVSSVIFNSIDQMMLGAMLSSAAAGAYNIAIRITHFVEVPTASIAAIVFPQSAKRMETDGKQAIKYLYEKSVGAILAFLMPGLLVALLFSDFVVTIIAGENYPETIPILRVTILVSLLIPYGRQFGTILDSINKPKVTFTVVMICAAINVILNYFMITNFGVIGAAYGTLAANILGLIIAQTILKRELGVNFWNTLKFAWKFYFELYHRVMAFVKPASNERAQ